MGSATMVMPSFGIAAPCNPHIGSDLGGGTFLAAIPESQCVLPTQHAIVLTLKEALTMRIGSAATKRHKKNRTPTDTTLFLLCFFVAITVNYCAGSCRTGFLTSFILHLRHNPGFLEITSSCMGQTYWNSGFVECAECSFFSAETTATGYT